MSTKLAPAQARRVWITVAAVVALIAIVVASFIHRIQMPRVMTEGEMQLNGAYMFETPRKIADFSLTDHHGEVFDNARLKGHWTLIFFGFTNCPDVCPTTMSFLDTFVRELDGTEAKETEVVMVSVDPGRDSVLKLSVYVPYFNADFTGVTGEFMDVHRFATALNTPFRKGAGQGQDYQVDHSSNVVLINPRGDYHGFFKAPLDLAKMKVTYRSALVHWNY